MTTVRADYDARLSIALLISNTVPYVVTLVVALLVSLYLLLDASTWVQRLMQLTYLSPQFKVFLLLLALGGFACSWLAEKYLLPVLAKFIGRAKDRSRPRPPKLYKQLQLEMRI